MKTLQNLIKLLLVAGSLTQISAHAITVTWEEEVLLNTGEIIWVNKEVSYSIKGRNSNPLDLGYVPDRVETISFRYGEKSYTYKGDAGIFVLAISSEKTPIFVAMTGRGWGYRNNIPLCLVPNYAQLIPDSTGQNWTWPEKIELWTYNLPANLLLSRPHPFEAKPRYTLADKAAQTYLRDPQLLNSQKVNPLAKNQDCR